MKINNNRSETPNSSPNPIKQLLNVIAHAVQKISSKIFGRQETPADSPPTLDRGVVKKQTTQKTTLSSIFHKIFSFFYRETPATPLPENNRLLSKLSF